MNLAVESCAIIYRGIGNVEKLNVEIKRFAKIEKIAGGTIEESYVLDGVMINKDIVHPGMRRMI